MVCLRIELKMAKDEFRKIDGVHKLLTCPFCGFPAELWEHDMGGGLFVKAAMCSNDGDSSGGQECPMYMPNAGFYKATKAEAIKAWNQRA